MTQDNLLDTGDDQIQFDETKDYYEELVGEGKKFKDEKALAKSKAFADRHIEILERRFDVLAEDYKKLKDESVAGAKLQDLIDKLDQQQQLTSREQNLNSNEDTKPAVDLNQVESLVSSKIQEHEQSRKERENFNQVEVKLRERYGQNYKSILKEQSTSLGLDDTEVNSMARKNPALFYKTFDLNIKPGDDFQNLPKSGVNTFAPKPAEKRTWSYYLKMKDKDPKAWMNPKIAVQMEKDSQALGKEFFDA